MKNVKNPNVAGMFYPDNLDELMRILNSLFSENRSTPSLKNLQGIIAPHAGLIYSGCVAASAYKYLKEMKRKPDSIAVLSPTHYYDLNEIAVHDATHFKTPMGPMPLDLDIIESLLKKNLVQSTPQVFEKEHALEVHLPFLQMLLPYSKLIPLIVGRTSPEEVEDVIEELKRNNVFIVVSSDLSHFHDYKTAREIDKNTCKIIEKKEYENLKPSYACGYYPIKGLLKWSIAKGLTVDAIDVRNSGDTAGDKSRVVGYGAFCVSSV